MPDAAAFGPRARASATASRSRNNLAAAPSLIVGHKPGLDPHGVLGVLPKTFPARGIEQVVILGVLHLKIIWKPMEYHDATLDAAMAYVSDFLTLPHNDVQDVGARLT